MRTPRGLRLRHALVGHEAAILDVAWSPDGALVAGASRDGTVRVWEADAGRLLRTLRRHDGAVAAIAFAPDGKLFASGGADRALVLWRLDTGEPALTRDDVEAPILRLAFAPDGVTLAAVTADGFARWSATSGELLGEERLAGARDLAWSPDGTRLAVAAGEGVALWDAAGGRLGEVPLDAPQASAIAWSPDGGVLHAGTTGGAILAFPVAAEGEQEAPQALAPHRGPVVSLARSDEPRLLASKSRDGTVRLWDLASAAAIAILDEPVADDDTPRLAFRPRSSTLATPGGPDHALHLWQLDVPRLLSATPTQPLDPHLAATEPHAFDAFFCHDPDDAEAVAALIVRLRERGVRAFTRDVDLRPGLPHGPALEAELARVPAAAVFVGKRGLGPRQRLELDALLHELGRRGRPVIPVLLSGCPEPPGLPPLVAGLTPVDFRVADPDPFERLVWGITGRRSDG